MEFEKAESSFGYCIFCEDIRQEISNKLTYVGAFFGSELNVLGALPANIGKLCVQAIFKQRIADGLEPLVFEIHMPGDDDDKPTARQETPSDEMAAALPPPSPEYDDPFFQVGLGFQFSPLEIRQEGKIRASVVRAGKRYRLGELRVRAIPPPVQEAAH